MDEKVKAGLKAGVISWITLIVGPIAFLIAGVIAVDFARTSIRNQEDVVVLSLMAGMTCMVVYSLILISIGEISAAVLFIPLTAGILSIIGGVVYAKYRYGIPIHIKMLRPSIQNALEIPSRAKKSISPKFCPGCGRNVEPDWKICLYCKTDLERAVCLHCGSANPFPSVRCQTCGFPSEDRTVIYDDGTKVY